MLNQVILEGKIGTGLELHHDTSGGEVYTVRVISESDDFSKTDAVILTLPVSLIKERISEFQIGKVLGVKAHLNLSPIGRLQVLVEQIIFLRDMI